MLISVIVPSLGRRAEPERCLDSLLRQTYQNFEIVLVDQNTDDRLRSVVAGFRETLRINHVQPKTLGASRARNAGIAVAEGKIVGFPDDDSWYEPDVLERVHRLFSEDVERAFVTGQIVDEEGRPPPGQSVTRPAQAMTDKTAVFKVSAGPTLFFRSSVLLRIGQFDETLGLNSGTEWTAGEDHDLVLRALGAGYNGWYDPGIVIRHPDEWRQYTAATRAKVFAYNKSLGRLLVVHDLPLWYILRSFIRPIGGVVLSLPALRFEKARDHLAKLRGRLTGWWKSRRE